MGTAPITVLGVGNILLRDEGVGVRAVERLQAAGRAPAQVQLLDGGTLGLELLRFLKGTRRLLLLDALHGDGPAGMLHRLEGDAVAAHLSGALSVHDLGLKDVLAALVLLEEPLEEIVLLGVQPQTLEVGLELSPAVAAALPELEAAVWAQLARWQAEVV